MHATRDNEQKKQGKHFEHADKYSAGGGVWVQATDALVRAKGKRKKKYVYL